MRKEEFGEQELVVSAVLADLLSPSGRDLAGLCGGLLRRRPYPQAPAAGSSALSVRQAGRGAEVTTRRGEGGEDSKRSYCCLARNLAGPR